MASSAWTSWVSGLRSFEMIVRTCAANTHAFATRAAAERMSIAQGLCALRWANIESCMKCGNVSTTADHRVSVYARYWIHAPRPTFMSAGIVHEANSATPEYHARSGYAWYCTLALLLACTIPAFTWAKGQWIWFRCFTLVFWISMNTLLPEVLVPPTDIFNFATMDPCANIACAALVLAANVALFAYWLYKIVAYKRNPITGVLYCELAEFRTIVRAHCDDKDKYFLVDRVPETPAELGFLPDSPIPPPDGYRASMLWGRGEDRRHPSKRGDCSRP